MASTDTLPSTSHQPFTTVEFDSAPETKSTQAMSFENNALDHDDKIQTVSLLGRLLFWLHVIGYSCTLFFVATTCRRCQYSQNIQRFRGPLLFGNLASDHKRGMAPPLHPRTIFFQASDDETRESLNSNDNHYELVKLKYVHDHNRNYDNDTRSRSGLASNNGFRHGTRGGWKHGEFEMKGNNRKHNADDNQSRSGTERSRGPNGISYNSHGPPHGPQYRLHAPSHGHHVSQNPAEWTSSSGSEHGTLESESALTESDEVTGSSLDLLDDPFEKDSFQSTDSTYSRSTWKSYHSLLHSSSSHSSNESEDSYARRSSDSGPIQSSSLNSSSSAGLSRQSSSGYSSSDIDEAFTR